MDWSFVVMLTFYAGAVARARKPSRLALAALGIGALAAVVPLDFSIWEEAVVWIMTIDALICFACFILWVKKGDMQAWSVGVIGTIKNVTAFSLLCAPYLMPWKAFEIFINAAFAVQVLCAGGYCNAIGAWLDNCLSRVAPKRHKLLRIGS